MSELKKKKNKKPQNRQPYYLDRAKGQVVTENWLGSREKEAGSLHCRLPPLSHLNFIAPGGEEPRELEQGILLPEPLAAVDHD